MLFTTDLNPVRADLAPPNQISLFHLYFATALNRHNVRGLGA